LNRAIHFWHEYTSDRWVLDMVEGLPVDLTTLPTQTLYPDSACTDLEKDHILSMEIQKLLNQGILERAQPSDRAFVSHMFLKQKANGSYRPILNLSKLNENTHYKHFKMDHLSSVMRIVPVNSYLASIDITQAYFSLEVKVRDRDLLQLQHHGRRYRFTCLPNGYSPGPRLFTRVMKALMAYLRDKHGVNLVFYIDDTLIYAETPQLVVEAVEHTLRVLQKAGFTINFEKSALKPTQTIEYLGFMLHSTSMMLTLPKKKLSAIITKSEDYLTLYKCPIRKFSSLVGMLAATDLGNDRAKVLIKTLQIAKSRALCNSRGKYEDNMYLSSSTKSCIREWVGHLPLAKSLYTERIPELNLYTDASDTGWGAFLKEKNWEYGEMWCGEKSPLHINIKELLAVLLALIHFRKPLKGKHIHLYVDNTTALSCIRKGGSTQSISCNEVTEQIFRESWALGVTTLLTYIPSKENVEADRASRAFSTSAEWSLSDNAQNLIFREKCRPTTDLFASPANSLCDQFVSLHYYPEALATNAFSMKWSNMSVLIFPPFALIGRVLRKLTEDRPTGLLVVPEWKTQPWYPALTRLKHYPSRMTIKVVDDTLRWPGDPKKTFPMAGRMRLLILTL